MDVVRFKRGCCYIVAAMTNPNTSELLSVATDAARQAADVLMRYYRDGVQMRQKTGGNRTYDLVSDADETSEAVIAKCIRQTYPDHELLGEESLSDGDASAEHLWVIDPLDGTNNFAHRVPHFAISIAYYHQGRPVVGVVLNPVRDELFTAIKDQGAQFNGQAIVTPPAVSLDQVLIGCGFYYDRGDMMKRTLSAIEEFFDRHIHGIRRWGTASLDFCSVAQGHFGGFFEYQLSPWDFAAGQLIVQESGCLITTAKGDELPMQKTSVLAAHPDIHDAMLQITRRHHP